MGSRSLIALLLLLLALPASALEVFRIDSNGDQADANPGDALCATSLGTCTLRAAIAEANATSGVDFILADGGIATDPSGFVRITPQTALPSITETVIVDFDDAPGYDDPDPWATPIVQLDGSALSGSTPGIQITGAGAVSTSLDAIAIHGFPGHGVTGDVDAVVIQGCQIGIADGQFAVGNGLVGIFLTGNGGTIGQSFSLGSGWFGKGNVLSGNAAYGFSTSGDDHLLAGNRIGTDPSGTVAWANGGGGIFTSGHQTEIGSVRTLAAGGDEASGNVIAGGSVGVLVWPPASDTTIEANRIGTDATGTVDLGSVFEGILVASSDTTVGTSGLGGNVISGNGGAGIRVTAPSLVLIENNRIGVRADETAVLPNDGSGILAVDSTDLQIDDNVIGGSGGHGVEVHGERAFVEGNYVGTNVAGVDLGNAGDGIHVVAADGSNVGGVSNVVAFNGGHGVFIDEVASPQVRHNVIGSVTPGQNRGNGLDGIYMRNSSSGEFFGNLLGENTGSGIAITGGDLSERNRIVAAKAFGNGGPGIDLGDDGATPNDIGDFDQGENRLQNTPELDPALTTYNTTTGQIEVRYRVESTTFVSTFPLRIDFYLADADGEEGEVWLFANDSYPATPIGAYRSFSFNPPGGYAYESEQILATATDAENNTSEFGDPVPLPEPGSLIGLACGGGLLALLARRRRDD